MNKCTICGKTLEKSRETDFIRYHCAHCQIFYYIYAPTKPPPRPRASYEMEKPSVLALLFPFMVVTILEVLYHILLG